MKGCSNCKKGVILCIFHRSVSYFKTSFTLKHVVFQYYGYGKVV
jgi:hypothetical protein